MSKTLRWGVLSTGRIAGAFAGHLSKAKHSELVAVGSRSAGSAAKFGEEHGVPEAGRHASYEALLADDHVDAIYIGTPHPLHAHWAIKVARAGKHVLCEKPAGLNFYEAASMIEAARETGVFFMEAFMYRTHPQTAKIAELVGTGAVGAVRMVHAQFGFHNGGGPEHRLNNPWLGGGGILDVGCYPVSMARLIAGAVSDKPFADPTAVKAVGRIGDTGVDEYAAAELTFDNGVIAEVATAVKLQLSNDVWVYGEDGQLHIESPWIPARDGGPVTMKLKRRGDKAWEEITNADDRPLYAIEADTVADAVARGDQQAAAPAMSWDDTLGNMRVLDQWREAIGLTYPQETPACHAPIRSAARAGGQDEASAAAADRSIAPRPDAPHKMTYGRIDGLDKDISRLVIGNDNQRHAAHGFAVWDDYFERGGNAFDTGVIYGGGKPEELLGQWIESRGVRDKVVWIAKSNHHPRNFPDKMVEDFEIELDRLQTDHADIYLMHRDNPDVPVGEFVDALNEQVDAGRIKVFGGSNWTLERYEAANAYAEANGKQGMSAISNNFSLARMVDPVWNGCIANSDPEKRQWHERTQTPLMPWSSQARGFFTGRGVNGNDAELERCWVDDDNLKRRERAIELAKTYGVEAIHIAAAYVLCQPFPVFALFGPRQVSETASSMRSLEIQLSPEELAYLDLRAESPE